MAPRPQKSEADACRSAQMRLAPSLLHTADVMRFASAIASAMLFVTLGAGCLNGAPGPGDSVYTSAVVTVVLDNRGGGFPLPRPPGPCDPGVGSYTATVATHDLAWKGCEVVGTEPDQTTQARVGHRTLSTTEWAALENALRAIEVVADDGNCGADKPVMALIVQTRHDTIEYADDFYACQNQDKPLVDSTALDHAFDVAGQLAR